MAEEILSVAATKKTLWGALILQTDAEAMVAYLSADFTAAVSTIELAAAVTELGIVHGIPAGTIERIVESAGAKRPVRKVLLARGTPSTSGRDAVLEFHKKPLGGLGIGGGRADKVDYREVKVFDNITAGDLLATLHPAVEGQGGADIFGRAIPAPRVKDLQIACGACVEMESASGRFIAKNFGYLVFEQNKLSVRQHYEIPGDLTLEEGNVRFIGEVSVARDVPDGFEVQGGKALRIGGTVEGSVLRSDGPVEIGGGVMGKGKARIEAGGNFTARFLNDAEVICGGDVIIRREIVNSRVFAMGRVIVREGTIVGGEVVALKGICAADVGSELGVKTVLIAGMDYRVREKLLGLHKELHELCGKRQELLDRIGPMLEKALKSPTVETRAREEIDDLMARLRPLQRQVRRLEETRGGLRQSFAELADSRISVACTAWLGVTVVVDRWEREITDPVKGPLTFTPDVARGGVLVRSGLGVTAEAQP